MAAPGIAPAILFRTNGVFNNLRVRPAHPGEFIVPYANGRRATVPALPAGQIPPPRDGACPLLTPSQLRLTPEAGGSTVTVIPACAGRSGFPGLYQLVFQTPNLPKDDYRVVPSVTADVSFNPVVIEIVRA